MKSCINCRYSRDLGPYLACYGQKNAPEVDWNYVCEDWKPERVTNADRVRAMSDEEMAEWLTFVEGKILAKQPTLSRSELFADWLDWLKEEAGEYVGNRI